jgi:phosphate transport system substrate-binding protein
MNKSMVIVIGVVAVVIVAAIGAYMVYGNTARPSTSSVTLTETGSTLLYPVFNIWAGNYSANKITTAGTGSGAGISGAIAGTVVIGASDAFMTNTQVAQNPGILNIPILISSQYVSYNIPGLNGQTLKFNGTVLAGIFNGSINNWNNSQITALNPGVTFPSHTVVPVHRSDGSGDTNMFTEFLSKSDSWWNNNVGFGTNVNWPSVAAALTGNGNSGIISQMKSTQYSIGYIATTYEAQILSAGFGISALQNQAGKFVTMNQSTVMAAANQYLSQIPADGRLAIQYAPGNNSYPIVDLEYLIVKQAQPDAATATALKSFLVWAVNSTSGGSQSKYISSLNLAPLPPAVVNQIVVPLINKLSG